jgi:tetratricopeptide (TPR) repeat protein
VENTLIDLQKELAKYVVIEVEDYKKNLYKFDSKVEESINLYNKALESIKAGKSQDIAIIELKKAVKLRENFFEAINLLGLCYYNCGEKENAKKCFQSTINNEPNNDLAIKYLVEIKDEKFFKELGLDFAEDEENIDLTEKELNKNLFETVLESVKINSKEKKETRKFVAGILIGSICVLIMSLPFYFGVRKSSKDIQSIINKEEKKYSTLEKKYNSLNQSYKDLKSEKNDTVSSAEYSKNYVNLIKAEEYSSQGKYEDAADLLVVLKNYNFEDDDKEKFDSLYDSTIKNALWNLHARSIDLYYAGEYEDSLEKLEKVILYNSEWEYIDDIYYYIGLNYYSMENYSNAKENFNKIINNYQDSDFLSSSKNYIEIINNKEIEE